MLSIISWHHNILLVCWNRKIYLKELFSSSITCSSDMTFSKNAIYTFFQRRRSGFCLYLWPYTSKYLWEESNSLHLIPEITEKLCHCTEFLQNWSIYCVKSTSFRYIAITLTTSVRNIIWQPSFVTYTFDIFHHS